MSPRRAHAFALVAAAVLFSTGGAAIKACSLAGPQIACLRAAVSALAVAILLPESRRAWDAPSLVVGCAYAGGMTLFALANKLTTAANTIFLQSAAPLYIAVLSPLLLREPARRRDVALLVVLGAGLTLFFVGAPQGPALTATDPPRGNALAVLSGVSIALMMVGLRWLARRGGGGGAPAVLMGNLIAFWVTLPSALPFAKAPRTEDLLILAYLGVFQIGLAYALVTRALRHLPALEASMLLLVEPVLNPVWAWLIHGEVPGVLPAWGGVLILGATATKVVLDGTPTPGGS